MKVVTHIVALLIGFVISYWICYSPAPEPIKETKATQEQYDRLFAIQDLPPKTRTITITNTDTVEVYKECLELPSVRRNDLFGAYYGDVQITSDELNVGFYNTNTGKYQIDVFDIPQKRFVFNSDLKFGFPYQLEGGMQLQHKSGVFMFTRAGVIGIEKPNPYVGVGLGFRW